MSGSSKDGWQRRKVSRRALLGGAAGAAVGGAGLVLAGCGDDSPSGAGAATATPQVPSLIGPVDQQKQRRLRTGLTAWDPTKTFDGYTIFAPFQSTTAYAIDMMGEVVNTWTLSDAPTERQIFSVSLLDNGNLFAWLYMPGADAPPFVFKGGLLMEVDWDGNVVWEVEDPDQHHDALMLPNGNLLVLRAEPLPAGYAERVSGGLPPAFGDRMWTDWVAEMTLDGETVWEWHAWEHMEPEDYPINGVDGRDEWTHANGIAPMPDGNVVISFRNIDTLGVIDRETGAFTKLLGAPPIAQQHHPSVLDNGNILLFDNGAHRADSALSYSRVVEIDPANGEIVWEYLDQSILNFFSPLVSSAQRLPNGNTLIAEGNFGRIFEVTSEGEVVWEYVSSYFILNPVLGEVNTIFRAERHPADAFQGAPGA
ncbi:MAG: aryl-sulfate sulfotransferase [Dehalococcoidia bacterium]